MSIKKKRISDRNYRLRKLKDPNFLEKGRESKRAKRALYGRETENKRARDTHRERMKNDPEYAVGKEIARLKARSRSRGEECEISEQLLDGLRKKYATEIEAKPEVMTLPTGLHAEKSTNGEWQTTRNSERTNGKDHTGGTMQTRVNVQSTCANGGFGTQIDGESAYGEPTKKGTVKSNAVAKISSTGLRSSELLESPQMNMLDDCASIMFAALESVSRGIDASRTTSSAGPTVQQVQNLSNCNNEIMKILRLKLDAIRVSREV